jgi:hypothetical protein
MPITVEEKVLAENLSKGDKHVWGGREHTVDSVKVKVKWVTLTYEELPDEQQIERWKSVTVLREKPTPQEAYDQVVKSARNVLSNRLTKANYDYAQSKSTLVEKVKGKYLVDQWDLTNFINEQKKWQIYAKVQTVLRKINGDPQDTPLAETLMRAEDDDVLEAFRRVRDYLMEEAENLHLSHLRIDVSSAMDAIGHDVAKQWLYQVKYNLSAVDHAKAILAEVK